MKERWIDDIKAEMQEFESDSPKGLWESIEGRLPASKVAPTRSWWGWAAAAGALAVAGASAFLFFRPISPQEVISVEKAEPVVALNDVRPDPSEQIVRSQEIVEPVAVSQPKEAQRPKNLRSRRKRRRSAKPQQCGRQKQRRRLKQCRNRNRSRGRSFRRRRG